MSAPNKPLLISTTELAALYLSGLPVRALVDRAGLGTKSIRGRLKAAGVQMRPKGTRSHSPNIGWTDASLAEMYATGQSATSIGTQMGISSSTVLRRLRALGVEIRPHAAPHPGARGPRRRAREDCCTCCGILLKFSGDGLHTAGNVGGVCWDCAERWVQDGESWRPREDYVLDLAPVRVGCDVKVALWPGWRMVEEDGDG